MFLVFENLCCCIVYRLLIKLLYMQFYACKNKFIINVQNKCGFYFYQSNNTKRRVKLQIKKHGEHGDTEIRKQSNYKGTAGFFSVFLMKRTRKNAFSVFLEMNRVINEIFRLPSQTRLIPLSFSFGRKYPKGDRGRRGCPKGG